MKPTISELIQHYRTLTDEAKALPPGVDRAQIDREATKVEDAIVMTPSNSIGEVVMKLSALLDQAEIKDATVIADVIEDIRRLTGNAMVAPWERTIPGSRFATPIVRRPWLPVSATW